MVTLAPATPFLPPLRSGPKAASRPSRQKQIPSSNTNSNENYITRHHGTRLLRTPILHMDVCAP